MNFSFAKKRVPPLVLLLWALPSLVNAFDENIISQFFWGLLAVGVGLCVVLWGLSKLASMLIETLGKVEAPETAAVDEAIAALVGAGKVQWGLAVRVLLLSFPLQLVWLLMAYPVAGIARLMVPDGYYMYSTVTCILTSIPTIMLMAWLWCTQRPSMALGLGLSSGLIIAGLAVLMIGQGGPNAVAGEPVVVGPDQLPDKVYTYVAEMPTFPGGPDSLQAFVRHTLRYPALPLPPEDPRDATVHLRYVVGPDGNVAQVQVTKSIGPAFDDAAVRVVRSLPQFVPGRQNNEAVAVLKEIDITFH